MEASKHRSQALNLLNVLGHLKALPRNIEVKSSYPVSQRLHHSVVVLLPPKPPYSFARLIVFSAFERDFGSNSCGERGGLKRCPLPDCYLPMHII